MARVKLAQEAVEKSTFIVPVSFFDEEDGPAAPSSATWTLTDQYGVVVNGRSAVPVQPLAATVNILLTGNDLRMLGEMDSGVRLLLVSATYNSELGSDLSLQDEIEFAVRPLVGVQS
jgi:hypothetical protein